MDCFKNTIGLKEQCTSTSGLYINSLGINETMLNDIITSEHSSALEFLEEQSNFAVEQIKSSVISKLLPYFKSKTVLQEGHVGEIKDNKILVSGVNGKYRGVYLNLLKTNSWLKMNISKGYLFTNYTGSIDLKIIDITQGKILDTIQVDAVAGENVEFSINKVYKNFKRGQKLFIGYDTTGKDSYKVVTDAGCNGCKLPSTSGNNYVTLIPKQLNVASSFTFTTLENSSDLAGLQLDYSVQCDHESWMCTLNNLLATPILYKTAYLIMDYALTNRTRVNYTKIDIDWIKERKAEFDFEYNRHIQSVLQNVNAPNDALCFICNDIVRHNTMLP
jgi:hypothetical protein